MDTSVETEHRPEPTTQDVSREVAIADADYVLRWLIQNHEHPRSRMSLPKNILGLAKRAVKVLAEQASGE